MMYCVCAVRRWGRTEGSDYYKMKKLAEDPVANFRTVGLALTLKCNYSCGHCINDSGPNRNGSVGLNEAIDLISDISQASRGICFTGGESLLETGKVLECIRAASRLGLNVSLVSNGYWAQTRASAQSMISELASAGLGSLCISMDQFHLPFGKPEQALYIAEACKACGIDNAIRVCCTKEDDFADGFADHGKYPDVAFHRVPVLRMGRAASLPLELFRTRTYVPNESCDTVLAPIALPNGKVQACCGPGIEFNDSNPLNLGNWREEKLSHILIRARGNPLIAALHNLGPRGILTLLEENGFSAAVKSREAYTGICELCVDMCNTPSLVAEMEALFSRPEIAMRLIAGQAYQQCFRYLEKNKYLGLPQFQDEGPPLPEGDRS